MKTLLFTAIILFNIVSVSAQENLVNHTEIRADLNEIIHNISNNYVYLNDKNIDLNCIQEYYNTQIPSIQTEEETVLFFEYLLDEFYDNHLMVRTNRNSSFRLFSPIHLTIENHKPLITNVWQTQIQNLTMDIIGAEITHFNGVEFDKVISNFPTHCHDKSDQATREWIANKIVAGRYNEPRILSLELANGEIVALDLDSLLLIKNETLLSTSIIDEIGVIRINNSLGYDELVNEFDQALIELSDTKGLIIDLRNTIFGGDSYEARGIMSRFINEPRPYQKHSFTAKSPNNPDIERSWVEYVSPRGTTYKKPVVVLVGRWTGSMGEGLAIGFEGMGRAEVVGSEMRKLAGEVYDFGFIHQNYGYKLSTAKLFHVNGTLREDYIPTYFVKQTTNKKDETLIKGMELIHKMDE